MLRWVHRAGGGPTGRRRVREFCAVGIAAAVALAGCSGGLHSDAPATQVYVMRAAPHPQAPTRPATASLHVNRPMSAPGLDSDHIVLVQPDHKMSYFIAS